jgi:putative tryptophan/tyrosine transport system substrate-binding protein
MRRREFLTSMIIAASWPVASPAQQNLPLIGFLSSRSEAESEQHLRAFRDGLREAGYVEGQNVAFEYRWASGRYERLPELASDLVSRRVNVIAATGGNVSALAATSTTSTIPVVFIVGADPVALGLVPSLSRPGGNATGMSVFTTDLGRKRLELLNALLPSASIFGLLLNPKYQGAAAEAQTVESAAKGFGKSLRVLTASDDAELEATLTKLRSSGVDAVLVDADALFVSRRDRIVAAVAGQRIPAIYDLREFVAAGGLMSYGTSLSEAYRQVGITTGRILRGEIPASLPVQQAVKFEMVINQRTAAALGLTIPPTLLARADEVIE